MAAVKSRAATIAVMTIALAGPRAFSQDSRPPAPKRAAELQGILDAWVRNSSQIKTLSARFLQHIHRPGFGHQEYVYDVRWKNSGKAAINIQAVVRNGKMTDLEGVVLLPGAQSLLRTLPPERWTIATSCTRRLAEVRLRAAGLPVPKTMITSSDVKIGKPDPEPYLKAAAELGFAADDCIVVEDAPAGIRAGKAAGARVIAFPTTMRRRDLDNAGADWIVQNCSNITASRDGGPGLQLNLLI